MSAFRTSRGDKPAAPKKKRKKRSPGPRGRVTKRTGDLRSMPDRGKAAAEPSKDAPRALSGKAVRHLRALAHHLDAIVQIGKDGITDGVVAATREALLAHELVKVRIGGEAPVERKSAGEELAERTGAAVAQILGRTVVLYKRHPHKPQIVLPR